MPLFEIIKEPNKIVHYEIDFQVEFKDKVYLLNINTGDRDSEIIEVREIDDKIKIKVEKITAKGKISIPKERIKNFKDIYPELRIKFSQNYI